MRITAIISCLILNAGLMTCGSVHAEDLKISNDSKYKIYFQINEKCSPVAPVEDHSITVIPEKTLEKVCQDNPEKCMLNVYTDSECNTKKIASLVIDLKKGMQAIYVNKDSNSKIEIGTSIFNVFFHGPWV